MANKLEFPFVKKEGKYFAPIVQTVPVYTIEDIQNNSEPSGSKIRGGVKGAYARVRMSLDSTDKAELFALNTEFFPSSN